MSDASSVSGSPGLFSDLSGAGISNSESDLDGGPGLQVGPEAVVVDEAVAALAVDPGFAGSAGADLQDSSLAPDSGEGCSADLRQLATALRTLLRLRALLCTGHLQLTSLMSLLAKVQTESRFGCSLDHST